MSKRANECAVELRIETRPDGRTAITSPDLPGLHLVGPDLEALRGDIEPAVRDILKLGANLPVEKIRRIPSLGNALGPFDGARRREICVVTLE